MPPAKITYELRSDAPHSYLREDVIESGFIGTLQSLKYQYRCDTGGAAQIRLEKLVGTGQTCSTDF